MDLDGRKLLAKACWIWPGDRLSDIHNTYAHFRKDFVLSKAEKNAVLYITADQSYRLWINGKYVTRGPARGYQSHWPYDTVCIGSFLKDGENYISVEVYNPGVSTFSYIFQSSAGFLCAGNLGSMSIFSDSTWLARYDQAHKRDTANYSIQLSFQEHVDAKRDDRTWITSPSRPKGWQRANATAFGSMPWHDIEERGIPQLRETRRFPERCISRCHGKVAVQYKDWRNVAQGLYFELKNNSWKPEDTLLKPDNNFMVKIPSSREGAFNAVTLDMGETVVGPCSIVVEGGRADDYIDLFFHEICEKDGSPVILDIDASNPCCISMANRLVLSGNKTSYDFYQILGFRYVTIISQENTQDISLRISVNDTGYPYDIKGKFECSDRQMNDIWNICLRTEQVCSLDSYIDTPWREQGQWWGDARIQFWNTMAMDNDVRLFRRGIRSIAGQSVPNGLTYGLAPTKAHTCILPDYSLVWIMTIYDYYWQTGELSLFEEMIPRINSLLDYFRHDAPRCKGLLSYDPRYWLFLDWSNLEKKGSPTLYNMWYLLALRTLNKMFSLTGHEVEAKATAKEGNELEAKIENQLFDEDAGLFCDGLDTNGDPYKIHSVHSQTFAIMLGLKSDYHKNMFEKRILPFLKGEKLDVSVPSAYWTSYVITVAREGGFYKEALDFIKRKWSPMIAYSTCSEQFNSGKGTSSVSHAWSAHPIFHLMNLLGGIVQDSVNWKSVVYNPYFAEGLDFVRVKVPTPHGIIESKWNRRGRNIDVSLLLPDGIKAKVRLPGHEAEVVHSFKCTI